MQGSFEGIAVDADGQPHIQFNNSGPARPGLHEFLHGMLAGGQHEVELNMAEMFELMRHDSDFDAFLRSQCAEKPDKRTPQSIVERLPCRTSAGGPGEKECAVCLAQFEQGDRVRMLPCRHEFHAGCIDHWLLDENRTCPCCRADVCAAPPPLSLPTDLNALSVRELKDILASRAIDYRDCCEKSHLVERVSAHAIAGAGAEAGADAGVGSGLEGDGYYLPLVFSHHASELAEAIQSKSFDSLEGTLPEEAASHLLAMRPFVEELIRVQASPEWTNYDTETNHEDGLTLSDIASELMPGKLLESVNKHVSIKDSSELHPA